MDNQSRRQSINWENIKAHHEVTAHEIDAPILEYAVLQIVVTRPVMPIH